MRLYAISKDVRLLCRYVPCQGCGKMIEYRQREVDHLSVCGLCSEGILKLVRWDQRQLYDPSLRPGFDPRLFNRMPYIMCDDLSGTSVRHVYAYHLDEKILSNTMRTTYSMVPVPYGESACSTRRLRNDRLMSTDTTVVSSDVRRMWDEYEDRSQQWKACIQSFERPRYKRMFVGCTMKMKGILTRDAYEYVTYRSSVFLDEIVLKEDAQRYKYYRMLSMLPMNTCVYSSWMVSYVDVLSSVPCCIMCEDEGEADLTKEEVIVQTGMDTPGCVRDNYMICKCAVTDGWCVRIVRKNDMREVATRVLKRLDVLPDDVVEYIANMCII